MTKRQRIIFLLFIMFVITMSTVSASGLFKYTDDIPSAEEVKNYIIQNLDKEYSSYDESKSFEEVATLTIKNTYLNMDAVQNSNKKLLDFFDKVHGNESLDGYVLTSVTEVPLYHLSDESEYVVGIINTDEQSEVFDVVFAKNNDEGIVLDNEYYDYDTGLAYINIFDLYRKENETLYTDCVQAQLLRSYNYGNESKVEINISDAENTKSVTVSEDVSSPEISIPIDDNMEVENIYINGSSSPIEANDYHLSGDDLIINTSPGNLRNVDVDVTEKQSASLASAFFEPVTAYALSTDSNSVTDMFGVYKKEAHVGDYVDFKATGTNAWSAYGINYVQTVAGSATDHTSLYRYMVNHYGSSANEYVTGWYDNGKYKNIYRSTYNACYGIKMNTQSVKSYNNDYMKEWLSGITQEVQMGCIEVSTAAFQDMAIDDYLDYTAMITAVGDEYVAISFCSTQKTSRGDSNQVMCGTYAIKYEPEPDTVTVSYKLQDGYWPTKNHIENEVVKIEEEVNVQYLTINDEPKRPGYAFIGWTDDKENIDVAKYDIDDCIKKTGTKENITLYAVWKEAHDMEFVYTDYDDAGTYLYEDSDNFEKTSIKIPKHHFFLFDGYFTEDDLRVTDNEGNLVQDNVEGICEDGVFTNLEDVKLYAHFVDP